ncbi:MAG: 4-hydroxy-tetrahydrodipicolinate reductase [Myxococcota bacterium]
MVSGAAGRLGQRVVAYLAQAPDIEVVAALVRPGSRHEGRPVADGPEGLVYSSAIETIDETTVLVEVATRAAALEHGARAAKTKCPIVVATTGFEASEQADWSTFADRTPVLLAPNLSMGVTVLLDLVAQASKALAAYDVEILELHHNRKRDAPSGTAWALGQVAAAARGQDIQRDAVCARAGEIGPRGSAEIGLQSIRAGDIIGEHTVFVAGATERIELTHRAANRDAFAAGAVAAARFLGDPNRKPGLYGMRDVLGLASTKPIDS